VGTIIFPDPADDDSATCYEGSHIKVYKSSDTSITTMFISKETIISNSVVVDNVAGLLV